MKISVVIPTYNMASMLRQGLTYLSAQEPTPGVEYEVVVIDDGSVDETRTVVEEFRGRIPSLEYRFLPRGPRSCRAAARNRGIETARGELLVLLDSGIAVPPSFLRTAAAQLTGKPKRVLIHPVHGIPTDYGTKYGSDLSAISQLTPQTFEATVARLQLLPDWSDHRESYFNSCGENLDRLPAPWTLGWSTALSLHRALALEVGGFDEEFLGWGMEDTEFSYRLHRAGASFAAARGASVVHLPHAPLSSSEEKAKSNAVNALRMHRKHKTRDTELCRYISGPDLNPILAWLDHLVIQPVIPRYAPELLGEVTATYLRGAERSLAVGLDCMAEVHHLQVTHMLAHNAFLQARLAQQFPERTIHHLLGIDTLLPEKMFDVAVVTDFLRMLPPSAVQGMAIELCRLSKKVLLLATPEFEPPVLKGGQPWAEYGGLEFLFGMVGVHAEERLRRGAHVILELDQRVPPPLD